MNSPHHTDDHDLPDDDVLTTATGAAGTASDDALLQLLGSAIGNGVICWNSITC